MAREQRGSGPGFGIGLLLGGLLGVAGALLWLRRTELQSWDTLRERSNELRHQAEEVAARARQAYEELNQRSREVLEEIRVLLGEAMEVGRETASQTASELRARAQRLREEGGP